ncbi:MAG TPA: GHKL domain-containing protein [Candidatus Coprenecus stercoravium]|uniref:histidine kinase n=1 Tax=Candidatus Coprenecus stercoravium TaxID=2840735 RepID=A0A9D2GR34_9BACT|nr:GHKL domain-containing protein [Candidatus Coprenecus stercoravium]
MRAVSKHIFWIASLCFLILSFFHFSPVSTDSRARKVERKLHQREKVLESYAYKALEAPADEWVRFDKFPEDMVLYRYIDDTLQSWVNTFPISNDGIVLRTPWYRILDPRSPSAMNMPLAFLTDSVQYVNLGPKWYVVKVYDRGQTHIIAAIEVMEQYSSENSALKNGCNSRIGLNDKYLAIQPYIDGTSVVRASDGTPVFSIVRRTMPYDSGESSGLRWIALMFAIIATMYHQHKRKGIRSLYFGLGALLILQICTFMMVNDIPPSTEFFSPMLYADGNFNSFGALMLFHLYAFLYCASAFMARKAIVRKILSSKTVWRRLRIFILGIAIILLGGYIHTTFRSLIFNSTISFDLYRINDITVYTLMSYFAYSLLAMAMMFLINIFASVAIPLYRKKRRRHSKRLALTYVLLASIYMSGAVGLYGFQKECENLRVLTGRMAVERDLNLEMQLQAIEKSLVSDPFIRRLTGNPEYEDIILNRLAERYFFNILPDYDIRLTICNPFQKIKTDEYSTPTNCFRHFEEIIGNYGVQLSDMSAFYYLDYFRNYISYIGAFSIIRNGVRHDMYLEIDSKGRSDNTGYPSVLLDHPNSSPSAAISYPYSVAKYHQGRITSHQGQYNFPVTVNVNIFEDGFSHYFLDDYTVFINKLPGTNLIAVSRPSRGAFPTLISFSYLCLFFALMLIGAPRLFRKRHMEALPRPKRSFRMKMTLFLTASTVIALILMAIGTVVIIIGYMNNNNTSLMEEKLLSVQSSLSNLSKATDFYNEYNTAEILRALNGLARNTQVDVNLYNPLGELVHTSRPEVFNESLVSARINPDAYYKIVITKRMQAIEQESISNISYYSLYTPVYNNEGGLLAIANIPYFISDTNFEYDASPIIAAIINLYLIFIIAALLVGIAMSNSITKPLKEISKNMLEMDISHKVEHINYKADDELGLLVRTYNKMIDDLDRSTKELARSEREQAWSEMARQIAHEIKNPLTPMKLSIQHLIRMKKQGMPDWQDKFEALASSLIEQIDILSNTASEFSSFARLYHEEATEVDLVEILSEQKILFDNRDNIEMNFRRHVDKAVVLARKEQLTRTFVNLITNAVQAVETSEHGIINITLRMFPGRYQVDIEDNGSGVPEENREKLFSPNFTTKTKGSGLGLAICKSIVTQSHGDIYYSQSKELGGADFTVILPTYTRINEDYT